MLPDADSGRLLVAFWWYFIVASVTYYSGNLVAFITFPQIEPTIPSIDQMLSNTGPSEDVTWGLLNGRYIDIELINVLIDDSLVPTFPALLRDI